ncbi:serine hydrolase domain-containing protein [Fusibacter bizertensis]|uniref:Serine hydrolase domain-containing protein n=1 Tax=Fusibacter bizertensis TaxID=1488331 RepID=A0ABT6ND04_9FIRM|nr:serine hydrolase domain-containing protein [Fusibacter bizertensis]MDH8678286.1 serine hydrolase domain-containing protein [Fusibacter bizertensis]
MIIKKIIRKSNVLVLSTILLLNLVGISYGSSTSEQILFDTHKSEKIEQYIKEKMSEGKIPGLSIAIVENDEVLYQKGFGKTGNGRSDVTVDSTFITGSITKSFTALAARQLIGQNLMKETDEVKKYIPWFTLSKPDGEAIKVKDLMNHTSGLLPASGEEAYTYNAKYSLKTLTEEINRSEHTQYLFENDAQYSNLNYIILGHLVEVVTGKSYTEYVQGNILKPLNMSTSGFENSLEGITAGHRIVYGFTMKTEVPYPSGLVSSNYLVSNISDLSKYIMLLLNNGYTKSDQSIFQDNVLYPIDVSLEPGQPYYDILWNQNNSTSQGNYNGFYGAIGSTPNYNSAMLINQEKRLGIIILTNQSNPYNIPAITAQTIANDITDILLDQTPYVFESKSQISMWFFPIFAFVLTIFMLNEIIKTYRILLDTRKSKNFEGIKYIHGMEIFRGIISLIAYFGFPIVFDNSWRFFVAANPEVVLPILWIIVINILSVITTLVIRLKMIRKLGGIK